jgi:hypothetical protein
MKIHILILFTVFALVFSSCETTVPLDLTQVEERVVIEGLVTDHASHNYVKITRSTGFYGTGTTERITDAIVSVVDNDGTMHTFVHNPNGHADSTGYYLPDVPFSGVIGKTYKLSALVDGKEYNAEDELIRLVPIDKLTYRVNEDEQADPEDEGRFYELLLSVKEPQDTRDYYLFKCYRNDKVEYANETDLYFADDELIGENIDGVPLPVYYAVNDKARVEVLSLSRDAFVFYRDLQKLLANDGGLFGTPPANPRSNLSNGALGFFQVSALQSGEVIIAE